MTPLISICIPAYKQPDLLKRTLESIQRQTYKNLEIIVSDDSPDEAVKNLCTELQATLPIRYFKNEKALGSPANWNASLDKARGEYVMLLHHDDWFIREDALESYADIFVKHPGIHGIFSRNNPVDETDAPTPVSFELSILSRLNKMPDPLIRSNQIGPPSNLIISANVLQQYNEKFIWLVDIEFYIRLLKKGANFFFLNERLMKIGIHKDQITAFCYQHPDIILKENIWLATQVEAAVWKDVKFYDYYWRLLRNAKVRSVQDLVEAGLRDEEIPPIIRHMVSLQKRFSPFVLQIGVFSKLVMTTAYFQTWFLKKAGRKVPVDVVDDFETKPLK